MASLPIATGQAPVPASRNADSGNSPSPEINSSNQKDKINFPQLMKRMKGESEAKGKGKKGDESTTPLVMAGIHPTDAALPPAGIQLPPTLTNAPDPGRPDSAVSEKQSIAAAGPGKLKLPINLKDGGTRRDGKSAEHADSPVNAEGTTVKGPRGAPIDQKAAGNPATTNGAQPLLAHNEPQSIDKPDFNGPSAPARNDHTAASILGRDLTASMLEKHAIPVDSSSHMSHDGINGMNGLTQATTDKPVQTAAVPPPISVPLKDPQWGTDVGNRIMWMVQHDIQTANIKINPPHLGPLEVQVSMNKDHVDVSFNSHHATVKEALDASMPKLKEMMGSSGLQLGNANVTHHSFSGQGQYNNQGTNYYNGEDGGHPAGVAAAEDDGMTSIAVHSWDTGSGAIDFYA